MAIGKQWINIFHSLLEYLMNSTSWMVRALTEGGQDECRLVILAYYRVLDGLRGNLVLI